MAKTNRAVKLRFPHISFNSGGQKRLFRRTPRPHCNKKRWLSRIRSKLESGADVTVANYLTDLAAYIPEAQSTY